MRTELTIAALSLVILVPGLASATPDAEPTPTAPAPGGVVLADHLEVGVPFEVDLVGLVYGLRPEALWRFGKDDASRLRLAIGLLPGPEYFYLPVSFGYRAVWGSGRWHPEAGLGVEQQTFLVPDAPPSSRTSFYFELGLGVDFGEHWTATVSMAPDFAPFGEPGPGMSLRAGVRWAP